MIEVSRVIAVLCRIAPRVTGRSRRQSSESWSDTNRVVGDRCRRVTDRSHTRSKTSERNVRPRDYYISLRLDWRHRVKTLARSNWLGEGKLSYDRTTPRCQHLGLSTAIEHARSCRAETDHLETHGRTPAEDSNTPTPRRRPPARSAPRHYRAAARSALPP